MKTNTVKGETAPRRPYVVVGPGGEIEVGGGSSTRRRVRAFETLNRARGVVKRLRSTYLGNGKWSSDYRIVEYKLKGEVG